MATSDNKTRGIFGNLDPRLDPREQLIQPQIDAAFQPALATAMDLLGVLTLLPQAFSDAQRRELQRLQRSDSDDSGNSARVVAAQASIARADAMLDTARRGQARVNRLVRSLDENVPILHGFISDTALQPLARYRVQVTDTADANRKPLTATSAADGYFRIVLSRKEADRKASAARFTGLMDLMAGAKPDPKNEKFKAEAAAAAAENGRVGNITLYDPSGELVQEDPAPVGLDEGDVYREYVIGVASDEAPPPKDGSTPAPQSRQRAAAAAPRRSQHR